MTPYPRKSLPFVCFGVPSCSIPPYGYFTIRRGYTLLCQRVQLLTAPQELDLLTLSTKGLLRKYIFSVDVYDDLIGIRSTADWTKGNADVPFMKEVKTNYAASNEADGVIIDGCGDQI